MRPAEARASNERTTAVVVDLAEAARRADARDGSLLPVPAMKREHLGERHVGDAVAVRHGEGLARGQVLRGPRCGRR